MLGVPELCKLATEQLYGHQDRDGSTEQVDERSREEKKKEGDRAKGPMSKSQTGFESFARAS